MALVWHQFAFNPEFLTEANFLEDFLNADRTVIGASNDLVSRRVAVIFRQRFPKTKIFQTDPTTAEIGIKYEEVKKMAAADPRIVDAHLEVTTMWEYNKKIRKVHDWEEIPFAVSGNHKAKVRSWWDDTRSKVEKVLSG